MTSACNKIVFCILAKILGKKMYVNKDLLKYNSKRKSRNIHEHDLIRWLKNEVHKEKIKENFQLNFLRPFQSSRTYIMEHIS